MDCRMVVRSGERAACTANGSAGDPRIGESGGARCDGSAATGAGLSAGVLGLFLLFSVAALPLALVATAVEVAARSGGTIYVEARKGPEPGTS